MHRFERKKGISLAVHALYELLDRSRSTLANVTLVLAGGFDARLPENVQHLQELRDLVSACLWVYCTCLSLSLFLNCGL